MRMYTGTSTKVDLECTSISMTQAVTKLSLSIAIVQLVGDVQLTVPVPHHRNYEPGDWQEENTCMGW